MADQASTSFTDDSVNEGERQAPKVVFEININDAFLIAATVDTIEEALTKTGDFFDAPETDNVTIARVDIFDNARVVVQS